MEYYSAAKKKRIIKFTFVLTFEDAGFECSDMCTMCNAHRGMEFNKWLWSRETPSRDGS